MKIHLFVFVSMVLFISCSSTYYVKDNESSYREMNDKLKGKNVTLDLINSEKISAEYVRVTASTTYTAEKNYSTTDINAISVKNHGHGALKGFGYGLLGGGSFGFLMGYVGYSGKSMLAGSAVDSGFLGAILLGGIGAVTGLVLGALHGEIEEYVFPINEESVELIRVEISSVYEETEKYIIVEYDNKFIHLNKLEYKTFINTENGKHFIVIPKSVYSRKFK